MADVLPDPRPRVVAAEGGAHAVTGVRCTSCRHPVAAPRPRCPVCAGAVEPATFGPGGTVWSATCVRVPVPGREPPYGLAYVDLDDGPRILAHAAGDRPLPIGARVRIAPPSAGDDVVVEAG
jgi:uncharacterized OB-fold protein